MKDQKAKCLFLIVLSAILAVMLFVFADDRLYLPWAAEVTNPRQNESLYLEQLDEGIIYVGGEGKLYGTDMHVMLEGEYLTKDRITDIIIGDGITEIGYDVICDYPFLHSVRLGENVSVVGSGSIRECDELWFVYLPKGLKKASRDFLYDCNDCVVVAEGPAKDLPKLRNTKKKNIIENIDSFEALQSAWTGETELPEMLEQWW